jgi:hypothetical protein
VGVILLLTQITCRQYDITLKSLFFVRSFLRLSCSHININLFSILYYFDCKVIIDVIFKMQLLVIFLLLISIRAQPNTCSCSCCRSPVTGQSCTPTSLASFGLQNCLLESCLAQCRARYYECQGNSLTDYISVQCATTATTSTPIAPQFNCRCDCCSTGSTSCLPSYVGNALAYLCQAGSCSISCQQRYPNQCKADQTGLTQGTCTDFITTTTTTTTTITVGPWLGNLCKCTCCSTSSYCPSTTVGVASASSCSSSVCTQACRNQYPSSCLSSANISQSSGTCLSDIGASTNCNCECCETSRCINYKINTNEFCSTCDSICRLNSPCTNTAPVVVQSCSTNNAKTILPWMNFILLISIFTFFVFI